MFVLRNLARIAMFTVGAFVIMVTMGLLISAAPASEVVSLSLAGTAGVAVVLALTEVWRR